MKGRVSAIRASLVNILSDLQESVCNTRYGSWNHRA